MYHHGEYLFTKRQDHNDATTMDMRPTEALTAAAAGAAGSAPLTPAAAARLRRTSGLVLGPFYPVRHRTPPDGMLWTGDATAGATPPAIEITGSVVDEHDAPIADAQVEIWQADEAGRYPHPGAPHSADVSPQFNGYGATRTDAHGRYRFVTVQPGPYRDGDAMRAPHVHFQVTTATDRLVTQMFFPDDLRNASDRWYCAARRREALVASSIAAADLHGRPRFEWKIVLPPR